MGSKLQPKWVAWALIALSCAVLYVRYPGNPEVGQAPLPRDFGVYVQAAQRVAAHQTPYVASDASPYKYSPGVLALMNFLPMPAERGWVFFSALSIFALAAGLLFGCRYSSWREVLYLFLGLGLAWKGILETLDYGQLELLIFGVAVISAASLARTPFLSGLMAGILPWFKLPWVLIILPLILVGKPTHLIAAATGGKRERRLRHLVSGFLLASFIWGAAVPSVTFGSDRSMQLSKDWLNLLRTQPPALYFSDLNQSFWISIFRWVSGVSEDMTGHHAPMMVAVGVGATLAGLLLGRLHVRAQRGAVLGWISPWLLMTQLLNPLSWRWGSVFVVGMPIAAGDKAAYPDEPEGAYDRAWRWFLIVVVFLLWLAQLNPVVKAFGYQHWADLHGLGLVTLYWLALLALAL